MRGKLLRGTESCGELQARCGKTVAAHVVFAGFGAPNDAEKARQCKGLCGTAW